MNGRRPAGDWVLALAAAAAAGLGVAFLMGGGGGENLASLAGETPPGAPVDPGMAGAGPATPPIATADRPLPGADLTGAAVEGRVVGPDGSPVGGATVTAIPDSPAERRANSVSGADGKYRLVLLRYGPRARMQERMRERL
ncbi:MAG: carboxypeptidase-like regulatory domain-containing protein [Planctomycetales bacterium]|nr:carboxypeptidase-like regulatory domain-containing protein [Planctomycetales bacterium]